MCFFNKSSIFIVFIFVVINEKYLNINNVEEKLLNKKDIIGRDDTFFKENIDETFPEFLTKNLNKYKKWVEL